MPHRFSRFAIALSGIALIAFCLRIGVRLFLGADDWASNGYTFFMRLAGHLNEGLGYSLNGTTQTAFRVPLYPIFLAITGGEEANVWAIISAQAALSAALVVLTALVGRQLFGPACGLLAAAVAAVWPYSMAHDTALQETVLFAFLAMLAIWLMLRLHERHGAISAAALGISLGLAILTRATLLPFAIFACLWLLVPAARDPARLARRARSACLAGLALVATMSPWLVHSAQVTGSPRLGTETGAAIFMGNHPLTFAYFPEESIDKSRRLIMRMTVMLHWDAMQGSTDVERDDWFREQGWAAIRANPERTIRYAAAKLWAAFGPQKVPRKPQLQNVIYTLSWTPLLVLGLAGLVLARRDWRRCAPFWVLIASFAAITALIWSQTSHKSFLDYTFMIFAAYALIRALSADWMKPLLARLPSPVQRAVRESATLKAQYDR